MALKISTAVWWIYLLECENGRLYTGISTDPARRFTEHLAGRGAMFTRLNRPARLIASRRVGSRGDALRAEAAFKKLTVSEKRTAAAGWSAETALED